MCLCNVLSPLTLFRSFSKCKFTFSSHNSLFWLISVVIRSSKDIFSFVGDRSLCFWSAHWRPLVHGLFLVSSSWYWSKSSMSTNYFPFTSSLLTSTLCLFSCSKNKIMKFNLDTLSLSSFISAYFSMMTCSSVLCSSLTSKYTISVSIWNGSFLPKVRQVVMVILVLLM